MNSQALSVTKPDKQPTDGGRSWDALSILMPCSRLITGGNQTWYAACSLPCAPRLNRGSHQPWITLLFLTAIPAPVTGSIRHWPTVVSLPRGPRTTIPGGGLQRTSGTLRERQTDRQRQRERERERERNQQASDPAGGNSTSWSQPPDSNSYTVIRTNFTTVSLNGWNQSRLNYNRRAHITHKRDIPGATSSGE